MRADASRYVKTKEAYAKLFSVLADRYRARQGGYSSVLKTYPRIGDGAIGRAALADEHPAVKERQEEVAVHISQIKKAVYDPDQGIYARLRELESWKRVHTKLMWITVSSLIGICSAVWINYIIGVN